MENNTKKASFIKKHPVMSVVLGLVIIIFFITMIGSSSSSPTPSTSNPTPTSSSVSVGQNGYLSNGQPQVLVGTTKENVNAIIKAATANDTTGMTNVVLAKGAFFVDSGAKVLVIDSSIGLRQVRLLDGDMAGQAGWVPMEFVKK